MPLCFGASASVRAKHTPQSANWAYDVHTFWPLSTHPPSTASARVDTEARSDPAPGSLNSWHHSSSAERIFESHRSFCEDEPCASSVGPARFTPMRPTSSGARARASAEQVRAVATRGDAYDTVLWKAMVDQGWTGVELSEADGGLGLSVVEAAVLAEQVGRHVAPAPFLENLLAADAVATAGANPWL